MKTKWMWWVVLVAAFAATAVRSARGQCVMTIGYGPEYRLLVGAVTIYNAQMEVCDPTMGNCQAPVVKVLDAGPGGMLVGAAIECSSISLFTVEVDPSPGVAGAKWLVMTPAAQEMMPWLDPVSADMLGIQLGFAGCKQATNKSMLLRNGKAWFGPVGS